MKYILRPSISTQSPESLGTAFSSSSGSAAFPASNDAIFVPVVISRPIRVKRLFCVNGNSTSGNIDMGIYTTDGAKIVTIGTTAQTGTSTKQFFDITDTYLSLGRYFMAVAMDNGTGTLRRFNVSIVRQQHYGVLKAVAAFVLPLAATFATPTATFIPNIGMELEGIL